MRATHEIPESMLSNEALFKDPFFDRFKLRHLPEPLKLNEKISKNYVFPTFYRDVQCAIGIFLCDYEKAKKIMPHPAMRPVKMTKGRSLVTFSCYIYRNVMNVAPYNEVAMTIPVMFDGGLDVPVLPMVASSLFKNFGFYCFGMPVTSKENQIRGNKIWGLPKVTQEIEIFEKDGDCVTVAKEEDGTPYFELKVPTHGSDAHFDVRMSLYSKLDNRFLQSDTCFAGGFKMNKYMGLLFKKGVKPDRQYLKIGNTKSAEILNSLDIEEHPFQFRYTPGMTAAFDLPKKTVVL